MFKEKYINLFKFRQHISESDIQCGNSFVSPVDFFSLSNKKKTIIQIDLSVVNVNLLLPKTGFLQVKSVEADLFEECSWVIIYSEIPVNPVSEDTIFLDLGEKYLQSPSEHISEFDLLRMTNPQVTDKEIEDVISRNEIKEPYKDGYIGGYPLFIQQDFRDSYLKWNEAKEDFDVIEDEKLDIQLLQLEGKYFGCNDGYFHIFISQEALSKKDFSKAYTHFDFG